MLNDTLTVTTMVTLFSALVRAVLIGAAFAQLVLIYIVIVKFSDGWTEKIMRAVGAICGLLLYLGAKAFGLSIPAFMLSALGQAPSYLTGIIGGLLPSLTGLLVAWYVTRFFNSRSERRRLIAMRVLALTMCVVFFLYTDIFVVAASATHEGNEFKLLLPNLTFTLAVLLYSVFRYVPLPDAPDTKAAG